MKTNTPIEFNPNAPGIEGKIFGLPYSIKESQLILLPVPWEATVSYQTGAAKGPQAILDASLQVDLAREEMLNPWELRVAMLPISKKIKKWNKDAREAAAKHIERLTKDKKSNPAWVRHVNKLSEKLNDFVYEQSRAFLEQKKLVGLIGGDHSTPFGFIKAIKEKYPNVGILHLDAHLDLREAYEDFTFSHASIMYNVLEKIGVQKVVSVGIRDYGDDEWQYAKKNKARVKLFTDREIKRALHNQTSWSTIIQKILHELPEQVYISFDIDGLDPKLCPHTGTPVPGGFEFSQVSILLEQLALSKKKIVGFDLNEVAPGNDEWDANVGARVLRELCNYTAVSHAILNYQQPETLI